MRTYALEQFRCQIMTLSRLAEDEIRDIDVRLWCRKIENAVPCCDGDRNGKVGAGLRRRSAPTAVAVAHAATWIGGGNAAKSYS